MTVEQIIRRSLVVLATGHYEDFAFMHSLSLQLDSGAALTTRQGHVAIKIAKKHLAALSREFKLKPAELQGFLTNPTYDTEPRISVKKRNEVRYIGDNLLAFSCSLNAEMKALTTKHRLQYSHGLIMVPVTAQTIDDVIQLIGGSAFEMDEATEEYLAICLSSARQQSTFVTCDDLIVCNICDNELLASLVYHVLDGELI